MAPNNYPLPSSIFRYVFATSWSHQIVLVILTVVTFLLEIVPLEIQRRVVNNLVKERSYQLVVTLCAAYAGAVLIQGATKLGLNIYRSWVGENAIRELRRRVLAYLGLARVVAPGPEVRGVGAAMIVAEVEPIGGFVGSSISEPLLQAGILLSVLAYIVHLDRWMAAAALAIFLPQLVFAITGNRLTCLASIRVTISDKGVSGVTEKTRSVIISRTLRACAWTYSCANRPGPTMRAIHRVRCFSVPVSARRRRSPSVRMPRTAPSLSVTGRPLMR